MAECRVCHCTEFDPCPGGCTWAGEGLCSRCAPPQAAAPVAAEPAPTLVSCPRPCADCTVVTEPGDLVVCTTCHTARICRSCAAVDVTEGFSVQCMSCVAVAGDSSRASTE